MRTHDTKCHQLLVLSCPLSFAFFPFITSSKKGRCHAPPSKACYACTQHGMTSTHSHLWHQAKGGRKKARPKLLLTMSHMRPTMCFIQRRSSSRCSHFSASFRSSIKMLGSDGSVEARMRIRPGPQFSISSSVRALTPRMSSWTVSSDPP